MQTQKFSKVVVHVITIDQRNHIAHLYKIQVAVIYSRAAILVTVTSECRSVKSGLGHCKSADLDQTP